MRIRVAGQQNYAAAPVDGSLLATQLPRAASRSGPARFFLENFSAFSVGTGQTSLGNSLSGDVTAPSLVSYSLAPFAGAAGNTSVNVLVTVSDSLGVIGNAASASNVPAQVLLPDLSEFPASKLNEDIFNGFALGQYDSLGSRLLQDHIGYDVSRLASLSSLAVKLGPDMPGTLEAWSAWLLVIPDSSSCIKSGGIL